MNAFKFIAIGAAVAYGVNYLTKKNAEGRSVADDITDKFDELAKKAPRWADDAKKYGEDLLAKVRVKA